MRKALTLITIVGLFAAMPLTAQEMKMPKPGPEHQWLMEGAGTWDAIAKSEGKESKGVLSCKAGINGLWVVEHYLGDANGVKFEGHGATSYDVGTKKFVNVWIDSMITRPMVSEGTYDKEKKVLTLVGNMPTGEGKSMKTTITITYKDADNKVLSLRGDMGGKDFEMVEITYKRRK